ncbi:ATP-binding cassette domain-containing protein [Paenibacillus allorhizosphaerae]|uniref:Energy-coupling factor transporter transmembrane protein EcfT n=1 Tax=Paenibacillus allorhizosphaerae TaxID=2849866 RepID=A0ABM8VCR0_9BACL|nr:ATP-binding cassette domain-containing protein [Paenibacillus allorhizosphaerae]CAG7624890.1 Energy-coupling factor transporter transmembrane protein EcfT [Paenibacillus allorhizosphaerae]
MMIRMDGVTVYPPQHHAPDRPLLHSIDTSFEAGTITLLAGRSGSGKSTLLHTLAGLIPMAQGGIRYGDIPLWTEKQRIHPQACASVGIAFQYPERQLFAENVRKELAYSLRPLRWSKQDKERATAEALQSVNLPLSILDEPVLSLSEGTKRKVAFAATVIGKPQWLLLDEPTSGMDSKGIQPLLRLLQAHSAAGGGVIVASHDLETFLPIADRVILLKAGAMAADLTPQQCCDAPELLARAEVGWPEQVRLTAALRAHGFPVGSCALTPEEAAAAIIERLRSAEAVPFAASTSPHAAANAVLSAAAASAAERAETAAASAYQLLDADMASTAWPETGAAEAERLPTHKGGTDDKRAESFIDRLHPIAKWICYISLSAGVLMQHHWTGIAAAAALCAIIAAASGNSYRIIGGKAVRFFVIFIVISSLLSGLRIELSPLQLGFEAGPALVTVKLLLRYLLIMALGLLLMATTGEQQMQTALEQALHPLERFKFPARLVTFAATLMMRFVTMLNMEIERLSLIVTARGKAYIKPGTIRLRDVRLFFIPLLLSMMKHAEDLAFALEARGYKTKTTSAYAVKPISFELRDNLTVAAGFLLLIVMWIIG